MKISKLKTFLCAILLGILMSGCSSPIQFYPMPNAQNQLIKPIPPSEIKIYITQRPDFKYEELGIITYTSTGGFQGNEIAVYEMMRDMASKIGATGLIALNNSMAIKNIPYYSINTWGEPIQNNYIYSTTTFSAMAIRPQMSAEK